MASKISGIDVPQPAPVGGGRAVQRSQDAVSGGASADSAAQGAKSVQITGTARNMAALDQKLRSLPDINQERVAQLSAAIEQGTYTIQPQKIADRLMSLERTLSNLPDTGESAK